MDLFKTKAPNYPNLAVRSNVNDITTSISKDI